MADLTGMASSILSGLSNGSISDATRKQLTDALNSVQAAIQLGSQRDYDLAVAKLMGIFNGQPTLEAANDVGQVNGQPTTTEQGLTGLSLYGQPVLGAQEAAGQFGPNMGYLAGQPTEQARVNSADIEGTYPGYQTLQGVLTPQEMLNRVQEADPGHYAAWAKAGMTPEQMWSAEFYGPTPSAVNAPTEKAREFNLQQQADMLKTAASLRGPQDYAQFMQYTDGGRKLLDQLTGPSRSAFGNSVNGLEQIYGPTWAASSGANGLNPVTLSGLLAGMGAGNQNGPTSGGGGPKGGMADTLLNATKGKDGKYGTGGGGGSVDAMGNVIGGGLSDVGGDPFAPVNQSMYDWAQQEGGVPLKTVQRYAQGNNGQVPTDWTSFTQWANQNGYDTSGPGQMTPAQEAAWVQAVDPGHYTAYSNAGWTPEQMWQGEGMQAPVAPKYTTSQGDLSADEMVAKVQAADPGHFAAWQQAGYTPEQMWASEFYDNPTPAAAAQTKQLTGSQFQILPSQINPANWDALGQTGQQVVLSLASAAGWDPQSFQDQINATRPLGTTFRPGSVGTSYAPLAA